MIKVNLNLINSIKYISLNKTTNHAFHTQFNEPSFKGTDPIKADSFEAVNNTAYRKALSKIKNVSKSEYDALTEDEKNLLRAKLKDSKALGISDCQEIKEQVRLHQKAAVEIKKAFDLQYGEGNYIVIPIGRSLSSIGKKLSLKIGDEDVKNIPMSSMSGFYASGTGFETYKRQIEKFVSTEHFEEYKKYLESIGLSKKEVNQSKKHYILMDYNGTGDSLKAAYMLLSSDYLLGNDKRNISYAYICDLGSTFKDGGYYGDLDNSEYKPYAFVNKLDFNAHNSDINKALNYKSGKGYKDFDLIKLFGFALMDDEYTKNHSGLYKKLILDNDETEVIPFQNKRVYLSARRQYFQDVYTDSIEIAKLKMRLEKANLKLKKSMSVFAENSEKENRKLLYQLEKNLEKKFPLEYEYLQNQKRFEDIKECLCRDDIDRAHPHIYKSISELDNNSKIFELLEFKQNYFDSLSNAKSKAFEDTNLDFLSEAYSQLQNAEEGMRKYRNAADEIHEWEISGVSSHIEDLKEFYKDFHPNLQKTLADINKKLPSGVEDVYIKRIDKIFTIGMDKEGRDIEDFKKEFEKRLNNIQPCPNQKDLLTIVNEQKEALKRASDSMLPF